MIAFFDGDLSYKAYHDPDTGVVDLLSSAFVVAGRLGECGGGLSLGLDEEDSVRNLCLDLAADSGEMPVPERPEDVPIAFTAEVEMLPEATLRHRFDSSSGVLRMAFGDLDAMSWARLGNNLLWLAIDEESRLAALVIEGISRDRGGRAQAAWLDEMAANQ